MGLDTMFKLNKQEKQSQTSSEDDGEFRSRTEEETASASARKAARRNSKQSQANDPLLPEKKRARRRLIGALAMVLAAIIGLPMLFDSEPSSSNQKMVIEIPSKEESRNNQTPAQMTATTNQAKQIDALETIDQTEEIIEEPQETKKISNQEKVAVTPTIQPETKNKQETAAETKVPKELVKKVEEKTLPKPIVADKKNEQTEAARALALLEGKPIAPVEKTATIVDKKVEGSFSVQVGAFSTNEKIRELQNKLKEAKITSYTQKIITKNGDVTRIRVGPFANKAEAEKVRLKLVKLGLNGSLVPH